MSLPEENGPKIVKPRARQVFAEAARLNLQRPFSTLLLLSLFLTVVSGSIAEATEAALLLGIILLVVETYIDISVILAAADPDPDPSGDKWIRAAFRRRVFWRYVLTSLAVFFVTGFGFVLLIVPGFIVAGRFGLAQATAVLDARRETLPIARSVQLTKPARGAVAVLFGAFLVLPAVGLQVEAIASQDFDSLFLGLNLVLVVLARTATIGLVKIYRALGGIEKAYVPKKSK